VLTGREKYTHTPVVAFWRAIRPESDRAAVRARTHIDSPMMSGHTPAVRRFSVRLSRK